MMLSSLLICYINFVYLFLANYYASVSVTGVKILITFTTNIICSCKYSQSKWQMFQIYILLDNILVALIAGMVGYIGVVFLFYSAILDAIIITEMACVSIVLITFAGSFRVLLANCQFKRYQVIVSKLSLILGCIGFLILGAYFMSTDLPSDDSNSNQDNVKDFFFLYIFGFFMLFA